MLMLCSLDTLSFSQQELFSKVGTVKRANVQYDKAGRSLGTAVVVFTDRQSCVEAIRRYNGVE